MKLFIDSADVEKIKELYSIYKIDGVSTNPSILYKNGNPPYEVLYQIKEIIGDDGLLFVQAVGTDISTIESECERITKELGSNTVIKIPANKTGLKAIKELSGKYTILGTAVYTTMQAYFAAINGAKLVAPYVNRITKIGGDGIETTAQIQSIFDINGLNCGILAASFKKQEQVQDVVEIGVAGITLSPDVFNQIHSNATVDAAVDDFNNDFANLAGKDINMANA